MDKLEELLPGIEEFLTNTLASESLSKFAEERRQYFVECLDIANLPPSVPPREGRVLPQELLKETEESSGTLADHGAPDFAATQREISRSFIEHVSDGNVSSVEKGVKVYDDIDQTDRGSQDVTRLRSASDVNQDTTIENSTNDDSDDNETDHYEVPVSKQFSVDDNSASYGTDGSSLVTTGSTEELSHESVDPSTVSSSTGIPPPVPARKDRSLSESQSRNSANDEDDKPPELPYRPPLPKRNEIYTRSDKSDRSETEKSVTSDPELSGDGDSTSYESFDEDNDPHNTGMASKYDVKLPKKPKKKTSLRRNGKLRKSKSPLQWEIDVPFQKLDSIDISGELFDKGKLKWNRRIVAISNGHMVVYKPEKDSRPYLIIPLSGYEATVHEREGKKGFEVRMVHLEGESHAFCLELKEWAQLWMEHINGHAKGLPPPKYHTHLAGSPCDCSDFYHNPPTYGSKNDLTASDANSPAETGTDDAAKGRGKRKKITRMGSFAFRATQFLENIGKMTSGRKKSSHSSTCRHSSGDTIESSKSFHLQVSSSGSMGNLSRELVSPTSDSSLTSVFGENSASSQSPTTGDRSGSIGNPWETDGNSDCLEIACKGHLSIFSNFNKRCWGKRWCLVRGNMFECYLNELSSECELNFPLKLCLLRRAVSETNSDFGLMLVEAEKEKITIEPLSKYEMGLWVRVLLRETSTESVPEGLEEFLQEEDTTEVAYSADRGKSVSSHEYEDPEETLAVVAQLKASYQTQQGATVSVKADKNANIVLGSDLMKNQVPDSLMLSCKYNQTTDSGFYSVKETNSDSDSSYGNSSARDKQEGGYSTIDSLKSNSSPTSQPTHKNMLGESKNTAQGCSFSQELVTNEHPYAEASSYRLSTSQPSTPLISKAHPEAASSSTKYQPHSHHKPTLQFKDSNATNFVSHSEITEHPKQNSRPTSTVTRSGSSRRTSQTILSPSGEEYSIILKRSERTSASQISSKEFSDSSGSSDRKSRTPENHETGKTTTGDTNTTVNNSIDASKFPFPDIQTKSLHCDPVISKKTIKTRAVVETTKEHNSERQTSNISKIQQKSDFSNDQPPPLPKSPVPNVHRDSGTFFKSIPTTHQKVEVPAPCKPSSSDTQAVEDALSKQEINETNPDFQVSWTQLISKPDTTIEELNSAIDSFKTKQVEIKWKRMAVHDKRQRVLSDEERLACEKEFAALDKLGESTDQTIRTLQNHLANIQGDTVGIVKTALSRYRFK